MLNEPLPETWKDFLPILRERFEHRNPELAARERLISIRQGSKSLHQYLKEFESLYSYLPEWSEADKIHRFVHGLQPSLKAKFCVDPATHQWWTSFDKLVAYISAFIADDVALVSPADLFSEVLDGEKVPHRAKLRRGKRQSGRPTLSNITKAGSKLAKYTNKNGDAVTRSKDVRSFCHKGSAEQSLCLCCFEPGHRVADCTKKPVGGVPNGFSALR